MDDDGAHGDSSHVTTTALMEEDATDLPKSGLLVRRKWIELILEGKKTWEIRGRATINRERIALCACGSSQVLGEARIIDSLVRINALCH